MAGFWERMKQWNRQMNGLPRKAWLIAVTLLLTWLFIVLIPYFWPFLLAAVFSAILIPLVRACEKHSGRIKLPRWLIVILGMLLLFGVLAVLLFFLCNRLFHELASLAHSGPELVNWISNTVIPDLKSLYQQYSDMLPASTMDVINQGLASLGDRAASATGSLSAALTRGAVGMVKSIPGILLSIVLTIMGTFYMTFDRERIATFMQRTFPVGVRKHSQLLKNNLYRSLIGQIKSQLTVSLIIMCFLSICFVIYGIRYGLLFGVIIGLMDALPVIGAGLFLIPWAIISAIMGDYATAVFMAFMYLGTVVIRQICEPRIVGANLGLYPLATMIAMFAGFQLIGVFGLIVGPVLLSLLKVVLEADDAAHGVSAKTTMTRRGKRKISSRKASTDEGETETPGSDSEEPEENESKEDQTGDEE